MSCNCNIGPGKFEGESALTFMAWEQAMLGNSDTSTGPEDSLTDWLRSPLNLDADQSVVEAARAYGYCDDCIASAGDDVYGVAVWEDSQGFVYSQSYATREEFDKALGDAQEAESTDDLEDSYL